ncbi:putative bifunctional inhibitor/plant lipid transfer protein/seed storage helical [Helianthus annuus]|nr:putative bifunctional inhibitor/plant lipid transfer protein/seed storage helical [Helianthus annuus]
MDRFSGLLTTIFLAITVFTVSGQISTPCTVSMIASFTPCVNYITGSSANGGSPTASCCKAVESLMTTSMDCTCLIVTGNVPFSLPSQINQALAITLPKACNSKSVPFQCKCNGFQEFLSVVLLFLLNSHFFFTWLVCSYRCSSASCR